MSIYSHTLPGTLLLGCLLMAPFAAQSEIISNKQTNGTVATAEWLTFSIVAGVASTGVFARISENNTQITSD
jgi:hypothetical protein